MSVFNLKLLPQLKPSDRKQKCLDLTADLRRIPSQSRTSVGALRSIRDDAVQQVHKNLQRFLHMPDSLRLSDNQANASSWCRKAFRRCAAARANTVRAR